MKALCTLPSQRKLLRMVSPGVHRHLRASTSCLIRAPHCVSSCSQVAVDSGEAGAAAHTCITRQGAANDAALALRARQRETVIELGGSESRACAGSVPRALADDAALLRTIQLNIEEALSAERRAGSGGACRRRSANGGAGRGGLASRLGQVLDARLGASRLGAVGVRWDELARLQRSAHVVVVPDLVQLAGLAAECHLDAGSLCSQRVLDGLECVCGRGAGCDARGGEPLVARQGLEERDGAVEVVNDFFGGLVLGVALWLERADAGAVLGPLVVPEGLVLALVVFPVCLHEGESVVCAKGLQDRRDVRVGARGVAVGVVGAITAVGPGCHGQLLLCTCAAMMVTHHRPCRVQLSTGPVTG
jgi:hypothetical protein